MSKNEKNPSAESILSGLARILAGINAEEPMDSEEEKFVARGMEIVNDWRRGVMFEKAREKRRRFEEFARIMRGVLSIGDAGNQRKEASKMFIVRPALQASFFLKLEKFTASDLDDAQLDEELLKLWLEFFENAEGQP